MPVFLLLSLTVAAAAIDGSPGEPAFREVAAAVGLDFRHFNGMSGKLYFAEHMGSAVALFDYDNDGDLDVYLGQGNPLDATPLEEMTFPPADPPPSRHATPGAATQWLREAHAYLIGCIRELGEDAELDVPRKAHWGQHVPTHHLVVTMLEHDLYHAGEINRTRALLQHDDAWWVPPDTTGTRSVG